MNAVIYCRVSSKEQVDGTSLESQEIACKEYAARNHLNVVRIFVERGESAKFADRTQLLELLDFCGKREHDVQQLLVWKVDRLARNVGDHYNIKASLLKRNIRVVSVTEPIDANPEGKLLETILAGFAQFDNDIRAARTLQGMRRKVQDGIFPWRPPLGYKAGNQPNSKKTEPDQPDQPAFGLLQQALNEFATGAYTKAQILRLMTVRGLRTRKGKPISKQSLDHILTSPFYAGIIRDPWTGEDHVGRHLPMVSRQTFQAVQRVIARRGRSVPHRVIRPEFPLRSFVRCGACEYVLTGAFSRGRSSVYPYYHCFYKSCTDQQYYPSADVHKEFLGFLDATSADQHALDHLKNYVVEVCGSWTESTRSLNERRAVEAKRIKDQQQQLIRMKMEQLITDEEFLAQRNLLTSRLSELEASVPEDGPDAEGFLRYIDTICDPLMNLPNAWDGISADLKRRFQQIVLPAGYVFGRIGTAQKGRLFSFLGASDTLKTNLVPLEGQSWNQLAEEITEFAAIFREASLRMSLE
jgi:DNA invertase Pin-like site-specific DNA recombinase